jgi:acylphosphatase
VQGVFFRDHTRKWASSFGLSGWVRNTGDGRVEITAEGEKESIESFLGLVRKGSPLSHVEALDVEWEVYKGEFQGFLITW